MVTGWYFYSHLVLWCTNGHQNKPTLVVKIYGMVLLLAPCPSMYKQAPNQTNFLVVSVYGMVLLLAPCNSMYKQAPKQTFFIWYVYEVVLLLASCTSMYKQAPKHDYL